MDMVTLKVKDVLAQKRVSNYWLYKQMGMSYQNFKRMLNNKTKSIKYANLDALCSILECSPGDLLEYNPRKLD